MKKLSLLVAPVLLVLALVLAGCPGTTDDGNNGTVESGDDGSVPKSVKPLIPYSEGSNPGAINDENFNWKTVGAGNTYGVQVTAGNWTTTEIIYEMYLEVMHNWAVPYASYKISNFGMNGAGTVDDRKIGFTGTAAMAQKYVDEDRGWAGGGYGNYVNRPVVGLSLRDAIVFCNALSEAKGKNPVYLNKDGDILKDANKEVEKYVVIDATANGYRLPTVDEFIYAANYKDGKEALPTYSLTSEDGQNWGSGASKQMGNHYDSDTSREPSSGATRTRNKFDLAYMYGNAWEWCYTSPDNYGLMGGDIWTQGETPKDYDWKVLPGVGAGDPGSKDPRKGPSYGFRIRTNKAE